jgi:putative spermidine/putrescine transport system substrate-binding protein
MKRRWIGAVLAALAVAAAACNGHSSAGNPPAPRGRVPYLPPGGNGVPERTRVGRTERALNLVVWNGYSAPALIGPFQAETGCAVHVTSAPGLARMAAAMASGRYDGVLAAGDASARLIQAKLVAPLDTGLLPTFGQLDSTLQSQAFDTVNGIHYGVPYQWVANALLYNAKLVKPAPTNWTVVFDGQSYKGNVSVYDSPMSIAIAAQQLKATEHSLGITDPYELTQSQFAAAVALMETQQAQVGHYWTSSSSLVHDFEDGRVVIGEGWPGQASVLAAEHEPVASVIPSEGVTGWADAWMMAALAPHPNCMVRWLQYTASPIAQGETALALGSAPANPQACTYLDGLHPGYCTAHHVTDSAYLNAIAWWKTPFADCGNGNTNCTPYPAWTQAWRLITG